MDKLQVIADYSMDQLAHDQTGHGSDHTKRVVKLAEKILETEPQADRFVTLAAAYLHDTIDDKVVKNENEAKQQLRVFLRSLPIVEEQISMIFSIIENMSFSKNLSEAAELSLEGKVVQDADRIEALGAIGILRTAYFGGGHGHPIFDPELYPQTFKDKENYRKGTTVINHFYEKLFLLSDKMNTDYGYEEAKRRETFMREFLEEFFLEWSIDDENFTPDNWIKNNKK
ncbi:HD domain-containing protein [Enterococcus faecium]|uniref:HD domain-containing protein n=1 Tax=Enterococcus faecium TaxID=1352 RepID=UPI0019F4C065